MNPMDAVEVSMNSDSKSRLSAVSPLSLLLAAGYAVTAYRWPVLAGSGRQGT
jgi:hypothetical protein